MTAVERLRGTGTRAGIAVVLAAAGVVGLGSPAAQAAGARKLGTAGKEPLAEISG